MAIEPGKLYSEAEVIKQLGVKDETTLQTAWQRKGLPVHRLGRARIYLGDELIKWVQDQVQDE